MTYEPRRWQKYGHDRLYLNSGRRQIGWIDLKTGRATATADEGWSPQAVAAAKQWLANNGLAHLPVQIVPTKMGDEVTTQEFLARLDHQRHTAPPAKDLTSGSASGRQAPRARPRASIDPSRDLAKNRPGSSAHAAARTHATWWRQVGRAMGMRTKDQAWRLGAEGEEIVARTLQWAWLRGWRVLHAVPVGARGSDIDHVLIGPAGVITINTKHHRGKRVRVKSDVVFVGRDAKKYGQVSQYEATRASKLLTAAAGRPVPVRAAVVIVGARSLRGSRSAGVEVMTKSNLLLWLWFQRRTLSREEVDELYELARRSTTWQSS